MITEWINGITQGTWCLLSLVSKDCVMLMLENYMKGVERFVSQFKSCKSMNSPSVCVVPWGKDWDFLPDT